MPQIPPALTRELGAPGVTSLSGWLDNFEETAELRWPLNMIVYDRMRRTDGQVGSVLEAIRLPILGTKWTVQGENVDPVVIQHVEDELGLNRERVGRQRRRREGVSFDEVLQHALLMLPFGFMPLEQVYSVGPPSPGLEAQMNGSVAHLRKLAPRMPRTISGFDIADDGGLDAIHQIVRRGTGMVETVVLPTDRLVMFVNRREGSDWSGTSILRTSYKNWLIKDLLIRLGPMAVERNGMGLPIVYYPADGDRDQALALAKSIRAGEEAGAALPDTWKVELLGVTGSVRDELPLVKYHDEAIGRSVLAMFLNLGHDTGARSLGETFVDVFNQSLTGVINNLEETITEYVIRDLVELNFGADAPYPELKAEPPSSDSTLTAQAINQLVTCGALTPDLELENDIRRRFSLPPLPGTPTGPPDDTVEGASVIPSGGDVLPGDATNPGTGPQGTVMPPPPNPNVDPQFGPQRILSGKRREELAARAIQLAEQLLEGRSAR